MRVDHARGLLSSKSVATFLYASCKQEASEVGLLNGEQYFFYTAFVFHFISARIMTMANICPSSFEREYRNFNYLKKYAP